MKKIIKRVTYNTDTAEEIGRIANGEFGDPTGYEEVLYRTKKGAHFIYFNGGEASIHPTEEILPVTNAEAKEWKTKNM